MSRSPRRTISLIEQASTRFVLIDLEAALPYVRLLTDTSRMMDVVQETMLADARLFTPDGRAERCPIY